MNTMKNIAFLFLACTISLVACGSSDNKTTQKTKSEAKAETVVASKPIELNKEQFLKKVMDFEKDPEKWEYLGDKPAIIDFYATWCGPCKRLAPTLDELASEYAGQIYIYKIDVDAQKELAGAFGIQSMPTLLFVPMNGAPQMAQGLLPKEALKQAINEVLLPSNNTEQTDSKK